MKMSMPRCLIPSPTEMMILLPVMKLASQSMEIVYGDIGTSPLYVYASTFPGGIQHEDDILGVLSLIFYTMTLITLVKYEPTITTTEALLHYSLICRYAKVAMDAMTEDRIVLILLVQRFGTGKMGYSFAPIISVVPFHCRHTSTTSSSVVHGWSKAINPKYIIDYFQRNGKSPWISWRCRSLHHRCESVICRRGTLC